MWENGGFVVGGMSYRYADTVEQVGFQGCTLYSTVECYKER